MVSLPDHYNFINRVPYKRENWQFHGILIITLQINLFSPHTRKVTFSAGNVKNNLCFTNH